MKKKVYFYSLLMAIVMMVVSPGRAWADCLRVYDNDHDLLGEYTFVNDQVFVDLGVGQYIELVLSYNESAECHPTSNALITSDGIVDSDNDETIDGLDFDMYGSRSLLVYHAGRYIVTLSNRSFDESEVKEDVWVENWVDEYTGDDADGNPTYTQMDNGYWENRTVGYSVITANATLTFREVPTFASIDELLAAELASETNVTVTVSGTIAMAEYESDIPAYQIILGNGFTIASMGVTSNPGWAVGGTISGTLQNVKFVRVEGVEGEILAVISEDRNIFAPEAGLNYTAPAGGSQSSDVASVTIGETTTGYSDIQQALAAAKAASSATLTLLQDVNLPNGTGLEFNTGVVTLDLNGHSIVASYTQAIYVNGGSLTITDNSAEKTGTVQNDTQYAVNASSGSLTIHAGTFRGSSQALYVSSSVNASVDGGRFVSKNISGVFTNGTSALATGYSYYNTATDEELADYTDCPINDKNGNNVKDITVKAASVKATVTTATNGEVNYYNYLEAFDAAKNVGEAATLKLLQNISLLGGEGLEFNTGNVTLDLNGHKIVGSGPSPLYVVTGGSLTITDNSAAKTGLVQNVYNAVWAEGGSLTIHAGTFECTSENTFALNINYGVNASIDGGRFISKRYAIFTQVPALATGYSYYDTQTNDELEGSTVHPINNKNGGIATDITVKAASVKATVTTATNGDVNYYTYPEAFDAAMDAGEAATLKLLQNISLPAGEGLEFNTGNVTLDLNGHSIVASFQHAIYVNGGALTITDNSAEKTGLIKNNSNIAVEAYSGTLTIHAGTFRGGSFALLVGNQNEDETYASVSIDGGRFISDDSPAVATYNTSALANGYSYYNTSTNEELNDNTDGYILDEDGRDVKDITVKAAKTKTHVTAAAEFAAALLNETMIGMPVLRNAEKHIILDNDITLTNGQFLLLASDVTIDLNGHVLTANYSEMEEIEIGTLFGCWPDIDEAKLGGDGIFVEDTHSTLKIKNGTVNLVGEPALFAQVQDDCTMDIQNVAISSNMTIFDIGSGILNISKDCNLSVIEGAENDDCFIANDAEINFLGTCAIAAPSFIRANGDVSVKSAKGYMFVDAAGNDIDTSADYDSWPGTLKVIQYLLPGENILANVPAVAGEFDNHEDPSAYNLYRFVAPANGNTYIVFWGPVYGALFSADKNFLSYFDEDEGSLECRLTGGETYYVGVRPEDDPVNLAYIYIGSDDWPILEMTIEDGTEYNGRYAGETVVELTYQRSVSESQVGMWQALYVPFRFPIAKLNEAGIDVACINNFHEYTDENGKVLNTELEIKMLTSGTLWENWPYLIRPKTAGEKEIVLENVILASDDERTIECSSVEHTYNFCGTYQPLDHLLAAPVDVFFLSGGALCTATSNDQVLKAQRWFLYISDNYGNQLVGGDILGGNGGGDDDSVAAIGIRVIGETDAATGIEDISIVTTVMDQQSVSEAIYDLQGRQLSTVGEGINIIRQSNGKVKKVMIIK